MGLQWSALRFIKQTLTTADWYGKQTNEQVFKVEVENKRLFNIMPLFIHG